MQSDKIIQLTQVEHIFKRSSMYIGNTSTLLKDMWIIEDDIPIYKSINYNDGYFKIIQEPIDNAIDEYIKTNGLHGNKLKISIVQKDDNIIFTIKDNGRGVSTKKIDGVPSAVIAFTSMMAGSNFNDVDRNGIGMNGVGISLTNLFSKSFKVITINHQQKCILSCKDNLDIASIKYVLSRTRSNDQVGTTIEFIIDNTKFKGIDAIGLDDIIDIIKTKLIEIKTFYCDIDIYLNDEEIKYGYTQYLNGGDAFFGDNIVVGIYPKINNEQDLSFVNCVNTYDGGNHLDYINTQIYDHFRSLINDKFKVDIKPSIIRKEFFVLFSMINLNSPDFIGQYKSKLSISTSDFNNFLANDLKALTKFLNSYFNNYIERFERIVNDNNTIKEEKEISKLIKIEKKRSIKELDKFIRIERHVRGEGSLFIAEGDSAIGMGLKVRDNQKHAFYAIGGKFINTYNMRELLIRKSSKVMDLLLVLGVDLRDSDYIHKIRFKYIYLLVDNDSDGQHIAMLLILFFYRFYPEFIASGRLRLVSSPLCIAKKGNVVKKFYSYDEFTNENLDGYKLSYYKGLGTYDESQYRDIIFKPRYRKIYFSEKADDYIGKIFSDTAYYRKLWLEGKING